MRIAIVSSFASDGNAMAILPEVSQAEKPDRMPSEPTFALRGDLGDLWRFLSVEVIAWFSFHLIMVNYNCPEFQTAKSKNWLQWSPFTQTWGGLVFSISAHYQSELRHAFFYCLYLEK